jgi:hypothetical protein
MKMGDGLDAHIKAHLEEHGRISWQTALGIAEWVIYPALAVRLAGKNYKNCSAEGGRRLHTQVVISRVLKRNYAKENGAISDGKRGIIYANWQKPEGAGAATEQLPVPGGNPGSEVPDQIMPASAPPELRQTGRGKRGRPSGSLRIPPQSQTPD